MPDWIKNNKKRYDGINCLTSENDQEKIGLDAETGLPRCVRMTLLSVTRNLPVSSEVDTL
jgi:hypothetical protein